VTATSVPVGGRSAAPPLTNWAGNVLFRAQRVHRPATIAQLQAVVAGAHRVRALGTGHSFNRIADTTSELVSVAGLPRVLEVDAERGCVRVSAGMRFGELVGPLHEAGFALHNLGSLPHISLAGALATGTHGSGVTNGTLASAVSALELVTADGSLQRLSRTDDPDRFDGSVVALGALGVVHAVELDVQPSYDLRLYVYEGLPLDTLDEGGLDDVLSSGYSVSLFTDWRSRDIGQVWRRLPASDGEAPRQWRGATLADGPRHPIPGLPGTMCSEQLGAVGPWHARLPHFRLEFTPSSGEELQSEWFVARQDAVAALQSLEDLRDRIAPLLQISEVRAIAADRLWLSPSAGRDTVAFHFTWVKDEAAVAPVVAAIEARLRGFGARPHWGKVFRTPPAVVRRCYERYDDFEALLRDVDPTGKFRNDLLDEYFPGARA
jgi:xylitol oxidase